MSRPFRLRPIEPLERDIQSAILRYLAVERRVAWARRFNTGAQRIAARMRRAGRRAASSAMPSPAAPTCWASS